MPVFDQGAGVLGGDHEDPLGKVVLNPFAVVGLYTNSTLLHEITQI